MSHMENEFLVPEFGFLVYEVKKNIPLKNENLFLEIEVFDVSSKGPLIQQ